MFVGSTVLLMCWDVWLFSSTRFHLLERSRSRHLAGGALVALAAALQTCCCLVHWGVPWSTLTRSILDATICLYLFVEFARIHQRPRSRLCFPAVHLKFTKQLHGAVYYPERVVEVLTDFQPSHNVPWEVGVLAKLRRKPSSSSSSSVRLFRLVDGCYEIFVGGNGKKNSLSGLDWSPDETEVDAIRRCCDRAMMETIFACRCLQALLWVLGGHVSCHLILGADDGVHSFFVLNFLICLTLSLSELLAYRSQRGDALLPRLPLLSSVAAASETDTKAAC